MEGPWTSRRSINQDAARVDVLERPEELSALIVRENRLFKASDTFDVFQVSIIMAGSHRNCQHQ